MSRHKVGASFETLFSRPRKPRARKVVPSEEPSPDGPLDPELLVPPTKLAPWLVDPTLLPKTPPPLPTRIDDE